jgi:hypothetical protein
MKADYKKIADYVYGYKTKQATKRFRMGLILG